MIPYNPSSFNSNKTILEQILELKRWLQAHPSYEVFYSSENGQSIAYTGYLLSSISDPTNLAVGDIVVFDNATFGVVTSVDTDNGEFGCDPCISLAGPQGPQGPQGVSITNVSVSGANHLIITLSNGTTIDAGTIQYDTYISISGSSGTLTDDEYAKALLNDTKIIESVGTSTFIYTKYGESSSTISYTILIPIDVYPSPTTTVQDITINKSTHAWTKSANKIPIGIDNIKSGAYPDGRIIRSNGSGGATWSTIGTDSMIGTSTAGQVMVSNGSYGVSWGSVPAPEGTSVKSTGATSGQVLTADGNGNASWQNASGGSFTDYVTITGVSGTFSDSDYSKLLQNDSVIINSDNKRIYAKYSEDNYNIVYENYYIYQNSFRRSYISVTKSTKTWAHNNSYPTVTTNNFYSGSATSGQVLQADGNGGASWQNAGGGSTLYRHSISISTGSSYMRLDIINNDATAINSFALLSNYLNTNGFTNANNMLNANGLFISSSKNYCTYGIIKSGVNIIAYGFDATQTSFGYGTQYTISSATLNDFVLQIS